jgi:hypothetical protein
MPELDVRAVIGRCAKLLRFVKCAGGWKWCEGLKFSDTEVKELSENAQVYFLEESIKLACAEQILGTEPDHLYARKQWDEYMELVQQTLRRAHELNEELERKSTAVGRLQVVAKEEPK